MKLLIGAALFVALVAGETSNPCGTSTISVMRPDPNLLVWDHTPKPGEFVGGWLNVPVLHDDMLQSVEKSPRMCLRIIMKPATVQPAKLGPLMVHCGGPGSDASCALGGGHGRTEFETKSLGVPLSEVYDYWSISQRGMDQFIDPNHTGTVPKCPFEEQLGKNYGVWPNAAACATIPSVLAEYAAKNKVDEGIAYILSKLDGSPDRNTWDQLLEPILNGPPVTVFKKNIYFDPLYVTWAYRLQVVNANLCYNDPNFVLNHKVERRLTASDHVRVYNLMEAGGTSNLAKDMELVRKAIGAELLSVYGISYGTKVGSVYGTMFPKSVKHLVLDGNMGVMGEVKDFAHWVGLSTEESFNGIMSACQANAEAALPTTPANEICPAGPGIGRKFMETWTPTSETVQDLTDASTLRRLILMVLYSPDVPFAFVLTGCIECLYLKKGVECCGEPQFKTRRWYGKWPGLFFPSQIAYVLGMDFAGRFTEPDALAWWSDTIQRQPVGITRSLTMTLGVSVWPAIPRPQPPAGTPQIAALVIGNLYDAQTPYSNAQIMATHFSAGHILTSQFYGHGLQGTNDAAVLARYAKEIEAGTLPTYDNSVAKLLCQKVFHTYMSTGAFTPNYVCKVKYPATTFGIVPVLTTVTTTTTTTITTTTTTTTTLDTRIRLYEQSHAKPEIEDISHSPVAFVSGAFALLALGSMAIVARRGFEHRSFSAVENDLEMDEETHE